MSKASRLMRKKSMIKLMVRALQRSLSCSVRRSSPQVYSSEEEYQEDVKEGHFAVLALEDEKSTRFLVSLRCLSNPMFLRLLELAEEEFGFRQEGILALPCRACELERIIKEEDVASYKYQILSSSSTSSCFAFQ